MKRIKKIIPQKLINYFYHLPLAIFASLFYGFPGRRLKVIGVTGTDGKTTTVNLIYHILKIGLKKVCMVSTVGAKIGDEHIDTGFHVTTPNPFFLQNFLKKVSSKNFEYVVLEVTSHGLDQFRLWGIPFEIGVLTNITHEHLDYHKTYENYVATKAKLLKAARIAIINRDDGSYNLIKLNLRNQKPKVITYGIKNDADFTPKNFKFETILPGEYNIYNCLAAIATASRIGVTNEVIRKAVASFGGVIGRMEEIRAGQDFKVFIDFAHTPNALEQILKTFRNQKQKTKNQKLIVVFGSAGLRDIQKRPKMGEIAARLADFVVLTAEDPRTEDVKEIIKQIAEGCKKAGGMEGKNYFRITDRHEAINFAIQKLAKKGDIVVICGKGHERSMCWGEVEYPWSDHEEVTKALKKIVHRV